jgi:hypothetical protein
MVKSFVGEEEKFGRIVSLIFENAYLPVLVAFSRLARRVHCQSSASPGPVQENMKSNQNRE